jgi:FtsH-binding integral membrane protein
MLPHNRPIEGAVATAGVDERVAFIRRTYAHLAGAIGLFVLLSWGLNKSEFAHNMTVWVGSGQYNWLICLGLFMVVGWVGDKWARSDVSQGMQYLGLALYIVAEAILFVPLLYIAAYYADDSVIPHAALLTLTLFAGLTGTVFITKKDFSFLRGALGLGAFAAMGVIVAAILFGFTLGLLFSFLMVALASGYVLYYTSQILAHYRPTQHVSAALALFSAIALMFWYILLLFMGRE